MATSEEKRVIREAIWKLAYLKHDCWQHVLRPAGVPWELVQPYLDAKRGITNPATGKPYTKYQAGPFIIEVIESLPQGEAVLLNLVRHVAEFAKFELAQNELDARAVVEKARGLLPAMDARAAEEEGAAAAIAARIERQRREQEAKQEQERQTALARRRALLLAEYDDMQGWEDHQKRGKRLEYVLQALFDLENIPARKPFRRNEAREQIDGGFEWKGHYILVQVKWHSDPVSDDDVEYARSQVSRSGAEALFFVSVHGWSASLVPLLKQNPEKDTVLMNGYELRGVLAGHVSMHTVIQRKLAALRYDSEPFVQVAAEGS